jgi:hypothetical protein
MGLFTSKEERAGRQEREARANAALSGIIIFPGPLSDLEALLNRRLQVVDTGWTHEKGLFSCGQHYKTPFHRDSLETREHIARLGIVAIVNAVPVPQFCEYSYGRYGVPVAYVTPQEPS